MYSFAIEGFTMQLAEMRQTVAAINGSIQSISSFASSFAPKTSLTPWQSVNIITMRKNEKHGNSSSLHVDKASPMEKSFSSPTIEAHQGKDKSANRQQPFNHNAQVSDTAWLSKRVLTGRHDLL